MRKLLVALAALCALVAPSAASAHPLGNFTVNRFAAVELSGRDVFVHYVLDLAEIPTVQEGDRVRSPGFQAEVARRLDLELDGRRAELVPVKQKVSEQPGAGGLPTLRFEAVYRVTNPEVSSSLVFHDTNFPDRIGWREIMVRAADGARIISADVPSASASDELRAYPRDLLRSPLDVTSAGAQFALGHGPGTPPSFTGASTPERSAGSFESLVERENLGASVVLLSLLIAAFWGAAHALSPGHGKAMVAAYLVGTRGTPRHAFMLGGTVTVAHTAGVFALGFVTLGLSAFIVPEQLYPWLTLVSGLLVVLVGASVLRQRLRSRGHGHHHDHHHHDHDDHHRHDDALTSKGILGVGIAAGLLPCPSALVVLLSAIALHRIGLGLALIVAFSLGLAATITGIGLVAVFARRTFSRLSLDGPLVRALPAASAGLILAVGLVITARALPGVL
jgi:nickel/cobalt exporter